MLSVILLSGVQINASEVEKRVEENKVNLYLFYSNTCPHCHAEREFLASQDSGKFNLYEFNVSQNQELFLAVAQTIGQDSMYVPYLVVGDKAIVGFGDEDTTGKEILDRIDFCYENYCSDSVIGLVDPDAPKVKGEIDDDQEIDKLEAISEEPNEKLVKLPVLGKVVDIKSFSLPVAAVILGFVDGFNPCAMWVLLFLITLLIEVKSLYRRLFLGTLFILASGIVYFAALLGWSFLFELLSTVELIKAVVAIVAFVSGYNLVKKFFEKNATCKVVDPKRRQGIFAKLKNVVGSKNLLYSSLLLIVVAFSVNLIELACSLGLPVVFAELLEEHGVNFSGKLLYIFIYILFYMLDDLVIFSISMITLETTGLSSRYARWVYLIGGLVMLIIGANLLMGFL